MSQSTPDLVTYLTEAVDPRPDAFDGLHAGDAVQLRAHPVTAVVEAWSARFGRLGRLPAIDGEALAPLLRAAPARVTGVVSALVPRPGRLGGTRIHIRLAGLR